MVMNPTRKCHLQYSGRPLRGACTDSCPWARVSQRLASPKKDDLKNLKTFAQLTMEVQNLLYLSASPPLEHSGADQELLKTKSGATGLALSSFGFGKKRPQRNATLKGKSQLQTQNTEHRTLLKEQTNMGRWFSFSVQVFVFEELLLTS